MHEILLLLGNWNEASSPPMIHMPFTWLDVRINKLIELVLDVNDPETDNPITNLILINTKPTCTFIHVIVYVAIHSIWARAIFSVSKCTPNGLIWSILIQCSQMKKIVVTKIRSKWWRPQNWFKVVLTTEKPPRSQVSIVSPCQAYYEYYPC